jgi:hypothetical protein
MSPGWPSQLDLMTLPKCFLLILKSIIYMIGFKSPSNIFLFLMPY